MYIRYAEVEIVIYRISEWYRLGLVRIPKRAKRAKGAKGNNKIIIEMG